jgi:glycosyltransferase involved in cell wall biosynthesis
LRICIIGKFPPIQGGVSMRTYWSAHALAERGHEVHVVTNAREVEPPFRMHMRPQDWQRCEAVYGTGSVSLHWTDPADRSQRYIPAASAFVSKLAAIAGRINGGRRFDVIYSHFMEPYGVAAYLVAQMTGAPHVVRMAGSDAGRLWQHPQFEALYDHILRSAEIVVAAGAVAERAIARGVVPHRIVLGGGYPVPEKLFTPDGPVLDINELCAEITESPGLDSELWGNFPCDRPYFGIYGKLGERKGSFALLEALQDVGDVGVVALAHGEPDVERAFRDRAQQLGLADRILQIPFLPHWRVPEFLRGCLAVCCLEQHFPIEFHTPIVLSEVLLNGNCLVASTELIRKLPDYERLPSGYGCVAIDDVNDVAALSRRLVAIVQDPGPAGIVGTRGRAFARELQRDIAFPQRLERILEAAAARRRVPSALHASESGADDEKNNFPFAQIARAVVAAADRSEGPDLTFDPPLQSLAQARDVLATVERASAAGNISLQPLVAAVRVEIAIVEAVNDARTVQPAGLRDPLFRLSIAGWAIRDGDIGHLVPVCDPTLRVIEFDYDISALLRAQTVAAFAAGPKAAASAIVVFAGADGRQREPLLVDGLTSKVLKMSDGTQTTAEIVGKMIKDGDMSTEFDGSKWIEHLFLSGMISLRDARIDAACTTFPNPTEATVESPRPHAVSRR